jgi:hypothetical protein
LTASLVNGATQGGCSTSILQQLSIQGKANTRSKSDNYSDDCKSFSLRHYCEKDK